MDNERDEQMEFREAQKKPQHNPRLVFNDPESFFNDLLMEQQEQM